MPAAGQAFAEPGERETPVWEVLDWRLALAAPVRGGRGRPGGATCRGRKISTMLSPERGLACLRKRRAGCDCIGIHEDVEYRCLTTRQDFFECRPEILRFFYCRAEGSEAFRELGEVRIGQVGPADSAGELFLLMEADRAVHAVIEHRITGAIPWCMAVASSFPLSMKPPSPTNETTGLSGATSFAAIPAGTPYPMAPLAGPSKVRN